MTGKLTNEHMDQLESWIGTGPKMFTLLYSITRDGCVASTFHQKCDNQGPTVTVLYNPQGSVYGGYTSASWNSTRGTVKDDKAFLYQLIFSGNNKHNKFPCTKNPDYAIYAHPSCGPTFGGGNDLHTFTNTVNSSGGYFALNGHMSYFGHSYDTQGVTAANVNNGNMNVTELEVYKVTAGTRQKVQVQPQTLPQKPWRKTPELNQKVRKCDVETCCTPVRNPSGLVPAFLPDPVIDPDNRDHFKSFQDVVNIETSERDMPSGQVVSMAKVAEEQQGCPNQMLVAQHVRMTVNCYECGKPRCIYSRKALTLREERCLRRLLEKYNYTCGSVITPDGDKLQGLVFVRLQLCCSSPIELPFYASQHVVRQDICCYCASAENTERDPESLKTFRVVLPMCKSCRDSGKTIIKRLPRK